MKLRKMILPPCWKAQLLIAAVITFATPICRVDAFSNFRAASHTRWRDNEQSRDLVLFQDSSGGKSRHNGDIIHDNDTIEVNNGSNTDESQMNESDIIRMLRANPHQCTKPIETASDVLHLMNQSRSRSARNTAPVLSVEELVNSISPNIAAAALRRLVSTPFIPLTFSTTKRFSQYLYKNQWSNPKNEVKEEEQQLYGRLMHLLVMKLSTIIDGQLQALMECNNYDDQSLPPKLLSKKETWHHPPTPPENNTMRFNWYALADLLSSLSVLHNIPQKNKSRTSSPRNGYLQALLHLKDEEDGNNGITTITSLFRDTIQYLSWDNKVTSSFIRCIGSRRLIRDLLHPLVIASTQQEQQLEVSRWDDINYDDNTNDENDNEESDSFDSENKNLHHLMTVASEYLGSPSSLAKVSAADLSIALWSLTQIYHPSQTQHLKLQSYRTFIKACMKRLRKRSVISPARGCEIALAIRSVERLLGLLGRNDDTDYESSLQPFQDILSLPIQLPGEEDVIDSYKPMMQNNAYGTLPQPTNTVADDLRSEAIIMFHTLVNELVFRPRGNAQMKLRSLSLQQVADILQTAIALNMSRDDLQTATIEVLDYLTTDPFILKKSNCRDISRILLSLQRLRVGTGMYNLDLEEIGVQRLGARFLEIVDGQSNGRLRGKCDPKTLTTVVRSGILMFPRSDVTKSLLDAASILIRDDSIPVDVADHNDVIFVDYGGVTVPFLEQCNDYELSWLLWAFAISRRFDKHVFLCLTDQILDNISDDSFTASSASRVMWSTSVLLSLDEAGDQHDGRHIDLFHQLSPILLSSHLSPTDLSCAMYAIAKTNYVFGKSRSYVVGIEFLLTISYSHHYLLIYR